MFNQPKPTVDLQEIEQGLVRINNIAIGGLLKEAQEYQTKADELESILEEKQEELEEAEEAYTRVKVEYETYKKYWQTMNQLEEEILKEVDNLREKIHKINK